MSKTAGVLKRATQRLWGDATGRIVAGQPIPSSHPQVPFLSMFSMFSNGLYESHACHMIMLLQLLAAREVTPGITDAEYSQRQATLASLMPANSFAVVPGAAAQYMVGLIPYPFRQDADFRYLTGLLQKNLVAVFESSCRGMSWPSGACN